MTATDYGSHPSDAVYAGLRGPQPEHGHGGPRVVGVREGDTQRNLVPRVGAPKDERPFEWGYFGRGPCNLARATLYDRLGFDVVESVAIAFTDDVVRKLSKDEFELPASEVDAWIAAHPEARSASTD